MKESISEVRDSILKLLDEAENKQLPRRVAVQKLAIQYDNEDIQNAISSLLSDFEIDLVVDYPSDNSGLNTGRPHWFLMIISDDEKQKLRELPHLKMSLLNILRNTSDDDFPGTLPIEVVNNQLIAEGYSTDEIKWLSITGRITRAKITGDEGLVPCYMIIPEYEKTEEYKMEEERMWAKSTEKEMFHMYIANTHSLANEILKAVRASPEGISKKDIIKQLFMDDPDHLKDAFEIATDEDEILPITLDNGEEGYRLNPDFENDD